MLEKGMTRNEDFSARRTLIDQLILRAVGGLFHRGLGERSASSPERPENGGSSCSLSLPRKLRAVSESEILLSAGANLFLRGRSGPTFEQLLCRKFPSRENTHRPLGDLRRRPTNRPMSGSVVRAPGLQSQGLSAVGQSEWGKSRKGDMTTTTRRDWSRKSPRLS